MTLEQTPEGNVPTKEQSTPESTKDLMPVDIDGVTVFVPKDLKQKMIDKRQEKHTLFKEISDKASKYEKELQETKRLEAAQKAALEGRLAESEALFNQKLSEKVSKYKQKVVDSEITSALLESGEFLGKEVLGDALKLIKLDHSFDLTDNDEIKAGEKTVKDVVGEWLKEKPAFKRVSKSTETPKRLGKAPEGRITGDPLTSGLQKFIQKNSR